MATTPVTREQVEIVLLHNKLFCQKLKANIERRRRALDKLEAGYELMQGALIASAVLEKKGDYCKALLVLERDHPKGQELYEEAMAERDACDVDLAEAYEEFEGATARRC